MGSFKWELRVKIRVFMWRNFSDMHQAPHCNEVLKTNTLFKWLHYSPSNQHLAVLVLMWKQDIHWGINEQLEHQNSSPEGCLQEMPSSSAGVT